MTLGCWVDDGMHKLNQDRHKYHWIQESIFHCLCEDFGGHRLGFDRLQEPGKWVFWLISWNKIFCINFVIKSNFLKDIFYEGKVQSVSSISGILKKTGFLQPNNWLEWFVIHFKALLLSFMLKKKFFENLNLAKSLIQRHDLTPFLIVF